MPINFIVQTTLIRAQFTAAYIGNDLILTSPNKVAITVKGNGAAIGYYAPGTYEPFVFPFDTLIGFTNDNLVNANTKLWGDMTQTYIFQNGIAFQYYANTFTILGALTPGFLALFPTPQDFLNADSYIQFIAPITQN